MSTQDTEQLFEPLSQDEWADAGGGGAAERGLYLRVLTAFAASGERYARIPTDRGVFIGKNASSIATALKAARDGKQAPEGLDSIKISSRGANEDKGVKGVVFLENTAVAVE